MDSKRIIDVFDDWAKQGNDEGMASGHAFSVKEALSTLEFTKPFRFLDFGCGNGWVVRIASSMEHCIEAWGIDASSEMIAHANQSSQNNPKTHFACDSIINWQPRVHFDTIFSMEALYYNRPMEKALEKLVTLLNPGGTILIGADFYQENEASHEWPSKHDIDMELKSMGEWLKMFKDAGLTEVSQFQVKQPKETASQPWKAEHGTLFTVGYKK